MNLTPILLQKLSTSFIKYRFLCAVSLLIVIGCSKPSNRKELLYLHQGWTFSQEKSNKWYSAKVPGVVHTDLLRHDLIPDPWVGTNEDSVQWVEGENWIYRQSFTLPEELSQREHITLVCEGLDTFAEVFINDTLVLSANNMFRTWRVNIKEYITQGKNEIKILFKSPVKSLAQEVSNSPYALPASSEDASVKVSPYIRKAPYHFGWDWGPRLVTSGVWRPLYLEFWDVARISDVHITQDELSDDLAQLSAHVTLDATSAVDAMVTVMGVTRSVSLLRGENSYSVEFFIENPKKWWPNGWGTPYLYEIPVSLAIDNRTIDDQVRQIGLRTVELVHEADSIGKGFYFKVNGEPIFAKGANYIPQHHFLPQVSTSDYRQLIADVKSAHMNMLRVWGGGVYEDDIFYQLCDENGILVWQDFIFANTMYPGDSAFLHNIEAEVEDNIKRLRNHPCIIHWNGNNEIEVAWENWGWQKQYGYSEKDSVEIWQNYVQLFHNLLPDRLSQLDPGRSYTSTSPLSNWGTPANFNNSTMHYWGVWHGADEFADYRQYVGRFMSEYGFQSFPNIQTIAAFADSSQWHIDSTVMKHHQKSYVGNQMIAHHIQQHFDQVDDFTGFVENSQLTQSLGMKIAIDAHRLSKGHCWGSLYWQLNDCWPGPSWSSRDVYGRWKVLHHELGTLFAPVALIPQPNKDTLKIALVNDLPRTIRANASFVLTDEDGDVLGKESIMITASKNEVQDLWKVPFSKNQQLLLTISDGDSILFERKESY